MRIAALVAILLMGAPAVLAAQPARAQADSGDRDAECFLLAAIGSQRLMTNPNISPAAREAEPRLRATANYFAGRLSVRLSGDALRQALSRASGAVQRPNLGALVEGCQADFQAFMRTVATPAGGRS